MHRTLITRLGVATSLVAAVVALVFVLVFESVRTDRAAGRDADRSEQIADVARELDLVVDAVSLGIRSLAEDQADSELVAARNELPRLADEHQELAGLDEERRARADAIEQRLRSWINDEVDPVLRQTGELPAGSSSATLGDLRRRLADVQRREEARVEVQRARASDAENRAKTLAVTGIAGSAALIFVLTAYVAQFVVVPMRRVTRAAERISAGDLGVRVAEGGDAEPRALARAFNTMAASLEQRSDELARRVRINDAVLDATPDAIGLYGPDGTVVLENAPMESLTGGDAPVLDGPGEDPGREVADVVERGDTVLARWAAPVHDAEGRLLGRIVVLRDITAEREGERLKDEFFALVSHELRTPLTSILGFLELVLDEDEPLDPGVRRQLEVVHRNARRLLRLVGDMLFVAGAQAGRLSIQRGPVDLGAVVADSVEAARPAAEDARVALRLHAHPLPSMTGDHDRLGQLLDNLVSNAVKFTPPGGEVEVRLAPVDGPRGGAQIDVVDTGPGIEPHEQARLFERFYRAPSATDAGVPGMGLGLTIVEAIAHAHGGEVQVASRPGQGTAVRVRLPYAAGDGAAGDR